MVMSSKELGIMLRDLRKKQGLTQTELGRRVGLDQKKVSHSTAGCYIWPVTYILVSTGWLTRQWRRVSCRPRPQHSQNDWQNSQNHSQY